MIERASPAGELDSPQTDETEPLSAVDVADYILVMSEEMAKLAHGAGLKRLSDSLLVARDVATAEIGRRRT